MAVPDTHTFKIYAWDPMNSDRLIRPFSSSCHENNIKVQHTILGHQKDGWTYGYRSLAFIRVLARTDIHVDLGAINLPAMEAGFVEEVQLVLKNMVVCQHDIIRSSKALRVACRLCPSGKSCGLYKLSVNRKSFGPKLW